MHELRGRRHEQRQLVKLVGDTSDVVRPLHTLDRCQCENLPRCVIDCRDLPTVRASCRHKLNIHKEELTAERSDATLPIFLLFHTIPGNMCRSEIWHNYAACHVLSVVVTAHAHVSRRQEGSYWQTDTTRCHYTHGVLAVHQRIERIANGLIGR